MDSPRVFNAKLSSKSSQIIREEGKMPVTMKTRNSSIIFRVHRLETFSEIACRYAREDYCPPGGCEMRFRGQLIQGSDTPSSLGMICEDIVDVSW